MMAVMVRMHGADRERFDTATSFVQREGNLYIQDAEGAVVAVFAAGRWDGVFHVEPREPRKPKTTTHHAYLDGKEIRKVVTTEMNSALGRLARALDKQDG